MNITKQQWEKIASIVLGATLAVFAVLGWVVTPLAPADSPAVEQRAVERIGILCAGESGNCVEGWNGSGLALYSDAGSTQTWAVNGSTGAVTATGAQTTSAAWASTNTNAASGSANPIDVTSALGIFNGSDDYTAIDINITNANHTGSNTVQGLDISAITGDSEATEYAINIGTGWDRGLNVAGGGAVIVGTVTLDAGEIGTSEIANITRTVSIPLSSFIECTTNGGADINYTDGADAFPDFINSSTDGLGFTLTFDATGGSVDTAYVCANFLVPADYASNGLFVAKATKGAETGANTEVLNCAGSINGAALGAGGTATLSGTAAAFYTCAPTLTSLAAGDSVSFEFHVTSGGTADDAVNLLAVAFEYLATQ